MKSYKFIVSGKVQGVYYRKSITHNAIMAGFSGYIKNLSNGDVEVCVTCHDNNLQEFINILKLGSIYSEVENIEKFQIDEKFENGFEVRY